MNQKQLDRMKSAKGFIAALDQSGGSTPKALKAYGVEENAYQNEEEMFDLVHQMRTRIVTSPAFTQEHILAAILFEQTMERTVEGKPTADYLWEEKGILPILKIDKGLAEEENHVKLMKPIPALDTKLEYASKERHIFGTKERSVILDYDEKGIRDIVDQQFEVAKKVCSHGMVPIIEPEVDIHNPHKKECEVFMKQCFFEHLAELPEDAKIMFKLTIPTEEGFYSDIMKDPHVVRVVALSGGYSQEDSCKMLEKNPGLIASFSRALAEDLRASQSEEEFTETLKTAIDKIYRASIA